MAADKPPKPKVGADVVVAVEGVKLVVNFREVVDGAVLAKEKPSNKINHDKGLQKNAFSPEAREVPVDKIGVKEEATVVVEVLDPRLN